GGMTAVVETAVGRFFSPRFLEQNSPIVAASRRTLLAASPAGYAGCCAAIRDLDLRSSLPSIRIPVLVIDGTLDASLPFAGHGAALAPPIPHAHSVPPRAAHLSTLEPPRPFPAALSAFLLPPATDTELAEVGQRRRRSVLGDAHVDQARETAVSDDFQSLITR